MSIKEQGGAVMYKKLRDISEQKSKNQLISKKKRKQIVLLRTEI